MMTFSNLRKTVEHLSNNSIIGAMKVYCHLRNPIPGAFWDDHTELQNSNDIGVWRFRDA